MINLESSIRKLQQQKKDNHIHPSHILMSDLMNEISNEVKNELNELYKDGRIGVINTLNQKAIFINEPD